MIFVDGLPFSTDSSRGSDSLVALMEHPLLVSASHSLKGMQEIKFSALEESDLPISKQSKWVYVFQREYVTVNPALVDFVGTDEATTCVGLVIRNKTSGMISVAHMDSPKVVDIGLTQMLSLISDHDFDVDLDVHIIGGYEDVPPKHANGYGELDGCSFPLCTKIIETLWKRREKFHIQTLFVLGHNTKRDSQGIAHPIFNGFLVDISTGSLIPATFDRITRCPDEIVRRIRVTACNEDPIWNGKLLETYDTQTDRFVIAPCSWTLWQLHYAMMLQHLPDAEILLECSTSPSAEGPDFVDNLRRRWEYLIEHPEWRHAFPMKQPRIFERTADGAWKMCIFLSEDFPKDHLIETTLKLT